MHLAKHDHTVRNAHQYNSLRDLTGRLCVFAVDLRGGLGIGHFYTEVFVDNVLRHDEVHVLGAIDLLELCKQRDTEQRRAISQPELTPRGTAGLADFSTYWHQRIAFAVRKALVAHMRSAGTSCPGGAAVRAARARQLRPLCAIAAPGRRQDRHLLARHRRRGRTRRAVALSTSPARRLPRPHTLTCCARAAGETPAPRPGGSVRARHRHRLAADAHPAARRRDERAAGKPAPASRHPALP